MYALETLLFVVFFGGVCWKSILSFLQTQARRQKEKQYKCEPVQILSRTGWLSRFTISRETLKAYQKGTRNRQLQQQHKAAGNTFRTHQASQIFTVDLENVKATIGGRYTEWGVESIRLEAFRPLTGPGTLTTDGSFWTHARALCQTNLNWIQKFRNSDLSCYDANIQKLLGLVPADGTTVNMYWLVNQYMIDSATTYILGKSVGALLPGAEGELGKRYLEALLHGLEEAGQRNEAWQLTDIFARNEFKQSCKVVHETTDRYVQQASREAESFNGKTPEHASLALMWAMRTKDLVEIRNQVLNVLVAASDTTAITIVHSIFHLARHPDCYQKLRKEALDWNGEKLTGDSIKHMKYLRAVVDETLRLNTPASFNSRMALCDTTLPKGGGPNGQSPVFVPKGDMVSTSIYSLQRDPKVYGDDADSFRPERWEEIKPSHWQYLPFSAGPRVCPGQKLAHAQSTYTLLHIARQFSRLENRDPTWELIERYQVSTSSRNGAKVAWFND